MKDRRHHLKGVQKKVMKSMKKEKASQQRAKSINAIIPFTRPKTILNKRKTA